MRLHPASLVVGVALAMTAVLVASSCSPTAPDANALLHRRAGEVKTDSNASMLAELVTALENDSIEDLQPWLAKHRSVGVAVLAELAVDGRAEEKRTLAWVYEQGQGVPINHQEAVKWMRLAADQGLADAQERLGFMYVRGTGVSVDPAEAARWWRKAGDQGSPTSLTMLGIAYSDGRGVPMNEEEAVRLFRSAAMKGDADAQYLLGFRYAIGKSVPRDRAEGIRLMTLAANQGHRMAQAELDMIDD